ncbi:hypothetical protein JYT11_01105, partial [Planctomycetaceae bacterium AH-315-I19]|nr:hypothetical protein [Planctomycetaceae bacterium AH-315-I19]
LRGISIQTSFDASEFKASLNSPPEDRNRIPLDWLRTIQVLDVEYARERLVDGEWIEDGIVPAVPGRESLRATIANPDFRPVQLVDLLKDERANRIDVRSPAVYKMISGLPWVAPVDFGKVRRTLPDSAQVARIVSSLKSKDAEIERLAVRRDDLADPEGRNRSQAQRIERELEKLNAQREAIVGELADLGVDEQGDSINEERDDLITAPPARETASNLLDEMGQITLWTHDVTAEKGNTFRYRARVVLTNPLFGRESRLQPEQKPEAQDLVVKTDWSAWSVPITLYPDVQYFVLGASPQQESNGLAQLASARVMACRFFYGYWRIAETRIEVGSVISAMVDLPELWKWEIAEGTDGPTLGSRTPIPSEIMISSDGFLLGVSEAVQDTSIPSLGELVVLSEAGSDVPVTRTPQIDRTSSELAAIRFSAQKGRGIAADSPETTPEP